MNLVGHDIQLVKELKLYILSEIEKYKELGYLNEEKYEELVQYESNKLDERIRTMESLL